MQNLENATVGKTFYVEEDASRVAFKKALQNFRKQKELQLKRDSENQKYEEMFDRIELESLAK